MTVRRRRRIKYLGKVRRGVETAAGMEFEIEGGSAAVTVISPWIVHVHAQPGAGEPGPDSSIAVVAEPPRDPHFEISHTDHEWTLDTGELVVFIHRDPFRVTFYDRSRRLLSSDAPWGGAGRRAGKVYCDKVISQDEHFYGFGEKAFTLDRRGKKMTMWTTDAANHQWESDPLYVSIPFFIGLHSGATYGIFFDTTWKSYFNMGGRLKKYYSFSAEGGAINYYFIAGPRMKDVITRYTGLTGRPGLPPLWSLGYHQSRWSYKNEEKVRRIAEKMREHNIPCDAIHLDIHYMDNYRVFKWNNKRFPDPAGMIDSLGEDGIRIVTIIDPGVKVDPRYRLYREGIEGDYFCRKKGGGLFRGIVWPGETHFPDFAREDVRDWWADNVAGFIHDHGHAGIWNDMNEPSINIKMHSRFISTRRLEHEENGRRVPHLKLRNAYGQLEAMATWDGLLKARPGERPFILTRSGFAGIQRYAAVWSGDNTSSWKQMHLSIPLLCSLGLSGVPFVGADIGGFAGNCTPELYARWIQLGAFYPFCRTHTMMLSRAQQPWSFGSRVTGIAREYISLRYRLLPYIYNCFRESSATGLPVMRPLVLEFRNDGPSLTIDDQFMLGPALLVAPVLEPGADSRDVYLPPGQWIDFRSFDRLDGSRTISAEAPLEEMPLYIRSGYILPMVPPLQHTGEKTPDPLILHVYYGAPATLELYEDDGHSYPAREYLVTRYNYYEFNSGASLVGVPMPAGEDVKKYRPGRKHATAIFHNMEQTPENVVLNYKNLRQAWPEEEGEEAPFEGWYWNPDTRTLYVGYRYSPEPLVIEIYYS